MAHQKFKRVQHNFKKKSVQICSHIDWTDNVFEKLYWLPLAYYKRPDEEIQCAAVRYFLLHYTNGTGSVEDWQNTLNILLLGLKVDNVYVLANEDKQKTEEKSLEFASHALVSQETLEGLTVRDNELGKWYKWCLKAIEQHKIELVATYFGIIALFLCALITRRPRNMKDHLENVTKIMESSFCMVVNNNHATPAPPYGILSSTFELLLKRFNPYAKEIVCRLAHRRLELRGTPEYDKVKILQDAACYNTFIQYNNGWFYWFQLAKKVLHISSYQLVDMLQCIGGFDATVKIIEITLSSITKTTQLDKTWEICRLLRHKAHPEWAANDLLPLATFISIAKDIQTVDDAIWNQFYFKGTKEASKSIELGISIGQSIRRSVNFDKQQNAKLNETKHTAASRT